jgi:phage shock protein C
MNEPIKHLYRSRTDRVIGGVCGGLSQFFNLDVTLIRLLFVLGIFFFQGAVLVYLVMLIIVPEEPIATPPPSAG